jgi:hypothetical protein
MPLIGRISSSVLTILKGQAAYIGADVPLGIEVYQNHIHFNVRAFAKSNFFDLQWIEINSVKISSNSEVVEAQFNEPLYVKLCFSKTGEHPDFMINLAFIDIESKGVAQCLSLNSGFFVRQCGDQFLIIMRLERLLLNPGRYSIQVTVAECLDERRIGKVLFFAESVSIIKVKGGLIGFTPVQFIGDWHYEE